MRVPKVPPHRSPSAKQAVARAALEVVLRPTHEGRYLHWDKLVRLKPPAGLDHATWWKALKLRRESFLRPLPAKDTTGRPFQVGAPDPVSELLHLIDRKLSGFQLIDEQLRSASARERYLTRSLMEEAITSSQLEGALTTRDVAKELLRTGRRPRTRSEQMIANNFATMRKIASLKGRKLEPAIILDLHRMLTDGAMDDPTAVARFRRNDERVVVENQYDEVLHQPPNAAQLEQRVAMMCDFANGITPGFFVHPAIRAIVVHFWLAYDHPFVDGNGRCARALFYWCMINGGYWVCEFLSISQLIRRAPVQYGRAFLYTETDENDLTYFVLYHLNLIRSAIDELQSYLAQKRDEVLDAERLLRNVADRAPSGAVSDAALVDGLNERQVLLLHDALKNASATYTLAGHQTTHSVVYETARQDLYGLRDRGFLLARKRGRSYHFYPAPDLAQRVRGAICPKRD
jgi:Fic family protein